MTREQIMHKAKLEGEAKYLNKLVRIALDGRPYRSTDAVGTVTKVTVEWAEPPRILVHIRATSSTSSLPWYVEQGGWEAEVHPLQRSDHEQT